MSDRTLAPQRETEYAKKVKVGEKVHNGKRTFHEVVDYTATDLKIDLEIALGRDEEEEVASCFYQLSRLMNL